MIAARRREYPKLFRAFFANDLRRALALLRDQPFLASVHRMFYC
jgi:hypothetical protein